MATKALKKNLSKGQRLGWTPIKDAKHVVVSPVLFKGKRVVVTNVRNIVPSSSLLIP